MSIAITGLQRIKPSAQYIGMSDWMLRKLAKAGEIAFIQRTPRSPMLFALEDLEAWIEKNRKSRQEDDEQPAVHAHA